MTITILVLCVILVTISYLTLLILGKNTLSIEEEEEQQLVMQLHPMRRISLHITGRVRDGYTTLQSQKLLKNLISRLPNVDVFTFIEGDESLTTSLEPLVRLTEDISHIKGNSRKMFYRMMRLQQAFEPYSDNYYKVIRVRPDIFMTPFPLRLLEEEKLVVFPRLSLPISYKPKAMTDIFFLGSVSDMRLINNIYNSYIRTVCNNPELFLYNFINLNGIQYVYEERMKVTTAATDIRNFRLQLNAQLPTLKTIMSNDGCG